MAYCLIGKPDQSTLIDLFLVMAFSVFIWSLARGFASSAGNIHCKFAELLKDAGIIWHVPPQFISDWSEKD